MKTKLARHGDILFKVVDKKVGKKVTTKTVAYGEVTGHHHSFSGSDNVVCYADDNGEVTSIEVIEPSTITHQEHKPVTLEKGVYEVYRKFEYDPFNEIIRKVRD